MVIERHKEEVFHENRDTPVDNWSRTTRQPKPFHPINRAQHPLLLQITGLESS